MGKTFLFLFCFSFPKPPGKLSKGKDSDTKFNKCNIENTMICREEKKRYKVPLWTLGYKESVSLWLLDIANFAQQHKNLQLKINVKGLARWLSG